MTGTDPAKLRGLTQRRKGLGQGTHAQGAQAA